MLLGSEIVVVVVVVVAVVVVVVVVVVGRSLIGVVVQHLRRTLIFRFGDMQPGLDQTAMVAGALASRSSSNHPLDRCEILHVFQSRAGLWRVERRATTWKLRVTVYFASLRPRQTGGDEMVPSFQTNLDEVR